MSALAILGIWTASSLVVSLLIGAVMHRIDSLRDEAARDHRLLLLAEAQSRHRQAA